MKNNYSNQNLLKKNFHNSRCTEKKQLIKFNAKYQNLRAGENSPDFGKMEVKIPLEFKQSQKKSHHKIQRVRESYLQRLQVLVYRKVGFGIKAKIHIHSPNFKFVFQ